MKTILNSIKSLTLLFLVISMVQCQEPVVPEMPGCTDPNSINFDPEATSDDGSCIEVVEGCIDPNSINFNPDANTDDGSCILAVTGCTDPFFSNYNPDANEDDGSCEIPEIRLQRSHNWWQGLHKGTTTDGLTYKWEWQVLLEDDAVFIANVRESENPYLMAMGWNDVVRHGSAFDDGSIVLNTENDWFLVTARKLYSITLEINRNTLEKTVLIEPADHPMETTEIGLEGIFFCTGELDWLDCRTCGTISDWGTVHFSHLPGYRNGVFIWYFGMMIFTDLQNGFVFRTDNGEIVGYDEIDEFENYGADEIIRNDDNSISIKFTTGFLGDIILEVDGNTNRRKVIIELARCF